MRDLEGPGNLTPGSFDFSFLFKSLDFEADSYNGIDLDVVFEVAASMVYMGSMINYTVTDRVILQVKNPKVMTDAESKVE